MKKTNCNTVKLAKGEISKYNFGEISLYAYKTNDFIDDEVFVVVKSGKGVSIELPCFSDNIAELTAYLQAENIDMVAKVVAYHGAGATFLPNVPTLGTESAKKYNTEGGGAALVANFTKAFGDIFDNTLCQYDILLPDGEAEIAGIKFVLKSNSEAFDIEIPQINCVYTHMMGHDCHSIVAGNGHADGIIAQLQGYLQKGFDLVLTSHYTPEDQKDVETKIDYLRSLKIAAQCGTAAEMKEKLEQKYPEYSGLNYLDMTVGMFFPHE